MKQPLRDRYASIIQYLHVLFIELGVFESDLYVTHFKNDFRRKDITN